jgi:metallo-beta-lactamase class B
MSVRSMIAFPRLVLVSVLISTMLAPQARAATRPDMPTEEQLANDNKLFLSLAKKALHWEDPSEPVRILGPLYFVGTQGLGVFLFTT